jgi:pilus assembly protein TadC
MIPFLPVPPKKAKTLSRKFVRYGERLSKVMPNLQGQLKLINLEFEAREYLGLVFFSVLFYFATTAAALFSVGYIFSAEKLLNLSLPLGGLMATTVFVYQSSYPTVLLSKRVSDIEKNLVFAIKNMLVHVTGGTPLFDAMVYVAEGDFGEVSKEFKKAVREIRTGRPEDEVLEEIALRNPSHYFRKSLSQLASGMRAGSDVSTVLNSVLDYLSAEQRLLIRRYGSSLNSLSVVYMMLAVVIPALGTTFFIVLSSFAALPIDQYTLSMLLVVTVLFQFLFLGVMRSKRPNLIGA